MMNACVPKCVQLHSIGFDTSFKYDLMHITGAVYRYYESRRRIINDAKPSRKDKVANNNRKRRNRQAQKNVGSNNCQACRY